MVNLDKLLWFLIVGSRGGINRARIISSLRDLPKNANQLSENLHLDYKTVAHHLKVLKKNTMITEEGDGYGNVYFLSRHLDQNYDVFENITKRLPNFQVSQEDN
ncbi:MAG: winged helix-turn-helix transcriptional regulator [Candidatus Heimdallarchaeota archaeon]|nr:winged helix-turn-helix transcriptional regulator [Candidatus Heimdallarchaeota archaeon]